MLIVYSTPKCNSRTKRRREGWRESSPEKNNKNRHNQPKQISPRSTRQRHSSKQRPAANGIRAQQIFIFRSTQYNRDHTHRQRHTEPMKMRTSRRQDARDIARSPSLAHTVTHNITPTGCNSRVEHDSRVLSSSSSSSSHHHCALMI